MKKKFTKFIFVFLFGFYGNAQCLDGAAEDDFPLYAPQDDGILRYASVNNQFTYTLIGLTAGRTYTFVPLFVGSNNSEIVEQGGRVTIGNETGTEIIKFGDGPVQYTPDTDMVVRYIICNDDPDHFLLIKGIVTGTPEVVACGTQEVKSYELEQASILGGDYQQQIAFDYVVNPDSDFRFDKIELNLFKFDGDPTFVNLVIFEDDGVEGHNRPGILFAETTTTITNIIDAGLLSDFQFRRLFTDLDNPVTLEKGKRYWIEVKSDAIAIEDTPREDMHGTTAVWKDDSQSEWLNNTFRGDVIYKVSGECLQLATSNLNAEITKIYPNPVKDILNIASENEIDSMQIFDISGKLVNDIKGNQNSLNLSKLATGTYLLKIDFRNKTSEIKRFIKQ